MATPVGHGLLGAGLSVSFDLGIRQRWLWFVFLVITSVAADFDFLPGLLVGDINRWHHQGSHSLLAAVVWGLATAMFFGATRQRRSRYRWFAAGTVAGLAYGSHLLLDCLTTDTRAPHGIPLLWPFRHDAWISPWTPIPGVSHGVPGDSVLSVLAAVFSLGNLYGALIECIVVLPIVLLIYLCRHRLP